MSEVDRDRLITANTAIRRAPPFVICSSSWLSAEIELYLSLRSSNGRSYQYSEEEPHHAYTAGTPGILASLRNSELDASQVLLREFT